MTAYRVPERLEDGDLTVRRPVLGDALAVFRAVDGSRASISRWLPWATEEYSMATAEAWIMASARDWPEGDACPFVITRTGQDIALGSCGLVRSSSEHRIWELGYWLAEPARGEGLVTRAARLVAGFAFEHLGCQRLEIVAAVDNLASIAVARRLGARDEGLLASRLQVGDRRWDARGFSLLPGDL